MKMAYKRKRKAAQSSKNITQKTRRIDQKVVAPTDSFASMPEDCILEVFNQLDLKSLQTMSTVSKSLGELSQYHIARTKISREGELRMVEWKFGHAFHLSFEREDPKYMYVIGHPNKAGAIRKSRIEYSGPLNESRYGHLALFKDRKITSNVPVPQHLMINLNILLERHSFSTLHLRYIRIDSSLLNYLDSISNNVTQISLNGLKVEENCFERFIQFVSSRKPQHFAMHDCGDLCERLMSEKFFMTFAENCNTLAKCSLRFDSGTHYEEAEQCRFYPSKETVDSLAHFQAIEMISLTFEAAWIPELIEKRLKSRHAGNITISITDRPDVWNFEQFPHLKYQHIRKNKRRRSIFPLDIRWNLVEDVKSGMQASFYEYRHGNVFAFDAEFSKIEEIAQEN